MWGQRTPAKFEPCIYIYICNIYKYSYITIQLLHYYYNTNKTQMITMAQQQLKHDVYCNHTVM